MAASKKINLLPSEEFSKTPLGRTLTWLLTTFRVLVVVTELIVLIVFGSRFWLDARITDLNEEIGQKKVVIEAEKDRESEFRDIQKRLRVFRELAQSENLPSATLLSLSSYLPSDVTLSSISFSGNEIEARAIAPSEQSIAQFIVNAKQATSPFLDAVLTNVDTDKQNLSILSFTVRLLPKKTT